MPEGTPVAAPGDALRTAVVLPSTRTTRNLVRYSRRPGASLSVANQTVRPENEFVGGPGSTPSLRLLRYMGG